MKIETFAHIFIKKSSNLVDGRLRQRLRHSEKPRFSGDFGPILGRSASKLQSFFFPRRFHLADLPKSQNDASESVLICLKDLRKAYFACFGPTRPMLIYSDIWAPPVFGRVPRGQFGLKIAKIDDFSENAPNHPDLPPRKFGGPKPAERGRFRFWEPYILYITPLQREPCRPDISRSRPKIAKFDDVS